jgi:hypothetical protein
MRGSDPLLDARRWLTLDGPDVAPMASSWFRGAGTPEVERHASFPSGYGDVSRPRNGKGSGTRLLRQVHALMDACNRRGRNGSFAHTAPRLVSGLPGARGRATARWMVALSDRPRTVCELAPTRPASRQRSRCPNDLTLRWRLAAAGSEAAASQKAGEPPSCGRGFGRGSAVLEGPRDRVPRLTASDILAPPWYALHYRSGARRGGALSRRRIVRFPLMAQAV